jgi:3-deoxy-D-manno-octulosonate 8-phosphate phosphatase (KDO 8-P phosphatase)
MNIYEEIKIVAMDVDGTLTDGIYQISELGIVSKSFYTKDFYAIEQLLRNGISVFIITQSHDNAISKQVDRIANHSKLWKDCLRDGILKVVTAVENKKEYLQAEILTKNGYAWFKVAYIGDAENDIECLKKSKFSGCPSDAIDEVVEFADFHSEFPGGRGAVYDFCMHILKYRKK